MVCGGGLEVEKGAQREERYTARKSLHVWLSEHDDQNMTAMRVQLRLVTEGLS